jgi:hypothetical protein
VVEILVRWIKRVVDLERATAFADASAYRNIPAEVCIAIYVQRVLRRRRADANVCAGCCTIQAVDAAQHQGVALTDHGVARSPRGGFPPAANPSHTCRADADFDAGSPPPVTHVCETLTRYLRPGSRAVANGPFHDLHHRGLSSQQAPPFECLRDPRLRDNRAGYVGRLKFSQFGRTWTRIPTPAGILDATNSGIFHFSDLR